MNHFSQWSRVELRARLADIDRHIDTEELRLVSLQNSVLALQDDHQREAEAQAKPVQRAGIAVGLFADRLKAQRQRESLIGYRNQAIEEIKNDIAIRKAEREVIKEVLAMRAKRSIQREA